MLSPYSVSTFPGVFFSSCFSFLIVHMKLYHFSIFAIFATSCLVLRARLFVIWEGDVMFRTQQKCKTYKDHVVIVVRPKKRQAQIRFYLQLTIGIAKVHISFSTTLKTSVQLWKFVCDFEIAGKKISRSKAGFICSVLWGSAYIYDTLQ